MPSIKSFFGKVIPFLFTVFLFLVPLVYFPKTSEVFEFNKMVVTYIFTTLITGAWIAKMIFEKKIIFRRTILDIPLLLFLGSQIISTLVSIDPRTSIFGYYGRFHGGVLSTICYCLLYWAYSSNMNSKYSWGVIKALLISAAIVSVYGILEHFGYSISCLIVNGEFNANCWVQDVQTRVFATLGQPNWLAAWLVALLPLAMATAIYNLQFTIYRKNLIWIMVSSLMFVAVLFTKSRSGLLGLGAAGFVFLGLLIWKKSKKLAVVFFVFFLLAGGVVAVRASARLPALERSDSGQGTESGDIRKIVWQGAVEVWRNYPVFGTGVETFAYSYYQFRPAAHNMISEWDFLYNKAHNEYLNFAATTGTVGLATYVILIIASIVQITKSQITNYKQYQNSKIKILGNWNLVLGILSGYISILVTNFFGFSVVAVALLFFLFPAMASTLLVQSTERTVQSKLTTYQKLGTIFVLCSVLFVLFAIARYWYGDILYSRGKSAFEENGYALAIKSLTEATKISPYEAIYKQELANVDAEAAVLLASEKEASAAATFVDLAVNNTNGAFYLEPRNINVLRGRVNVFMILGVIDPSFLAVSAQALEATLPLAPTDAKLFYSAGVLYTRMNKIPLAIERLQKAVELKPDYEDAKKALEKLQKL